MKTFTIKIIYILITTCALFGCKEKNQPSKVEEEASEQKEEIINPEITNEIEVASFTKWNLGRLELSEGENVEEFEGKSFRLKRTNTTETAYASLPAIETKAGSLYQIEIIVKNIPGTDLFGLRLVGDYPNRIDAVFNLKNQALKEVLSVGDYSNESATIQNFQNGWSKCIIRGKVNSANNKIIFGPTSGLRKTIAWEAATQELSAIEFIPSSLKFYEIE